MYVLFVNYLPIYFCLIINYYIHLILNKNGKSHEQTCDCTIYKTLFLYKLDFYLVNIFSLTLPIHV